VVDNENPAAGRAGRDRLRIERSFMESGDALILCKYPL